VFRRRRDALAVREDVEHDAAPALAPSDESRDLFAVCIGDPCHGLLGTHGTEHAPDSHTISVDNLPDQPAYMDETSTAKPARPAERAGRGRNDPPDGLSLSVE